MNSIWLKRSALPAAVLLGLLHSCSGGNSSSVTTAPVDTPTTTTANTPALEEGENGLFAVNISADAAGLIRLDIASPEPLPETISVGEATFIPLPVEIVAGFRTYVASPESTTVVLAGVTEIFLGVSQAEIRVSEGAEGTSFIYQNDPADVTFEDYILVRATGDLPPDLRTAANIATRANELFPAGSFTAGTLNPIPDELNTEFAAGGSVPPPDLTDALVVYAATFLPPNLRTPENLAAVVNALDPSANLAAEDILAIPGSSLPGGVALIQPVTARPAGTFQVSVQESPFDTPGFTIGNAAFTRLPITIFDGFTTYGAEPSSSLLNVEFAQLEIDGVDETTCVIVHLPGQDPTKIDNQISRTEPCGEPTAVTLTLLHNNDGESQLISAPGQSDFGGIARFATLADQLRDEAEAKDDEGGFKSIPLLVTSGDNTLAGPEFTAGLENVESGGELFDSIGLDLIGYDAFALGNHDFDFGPDILVEFINGFTTPPLAPFVSANLDFSGEPGLNALVGQGRIAASTIITKDGEQFGIVGATTELLRSISSPRNVVVNAVVPAVQAEINDLLGQGVDKIIFISHLQDVDEDLQIIPQLSGIDVAVAGGGDELLVTQGKGTLLVPGDEGLTVFGDYPLSVTNGDGIEIPVVTTPGDYKYLGQLILDFDEEGNLLGVNEASELKRVSGVAPDAVVPDSTIQSQVVDPVQSFVDGLAANVIATSQVDLEGRRDPGVRTQETNLGNLLADALRWQGEELAAGFGVAAPDVALQNGGGIRNNNLIPAGPFTELNTFDIAPFPNFVAIVPNIPRSQFKEILENAVSRIPNADGRFAQVSGFSFTYNPANTAQVVNDDGIVLTPGSRVVDVTLDNGTQIVVNGVVQAGPDLTIATNDFSARGGDQYPFRGAPFTSVGVSYQLALSNYIQDELAGVISTTDYPEVAVGGGTRIVQVP